MSSYCGVVLLQLWVSPTLTRCRRAGCPTSASSRPPPSRWFALPSLFHAVFCRPRDCTSLHHFSHASSLLPFASSQWFLLSCILLLWSLSSARLLLFAVISARSLAPLVVPSKRKLPLYCSRVQIRKPFQRSSSLPVALLALSLGLPPALCQFPAIHAPVRSVLYFTPDFLSQAYPRLSAVSSHWCFPAVPVYVHFAPSSRAPFSRCLSHAPRCASPSFLSPAFLSCRSGHLSANAAFSPHNKLVLSLREIVLLLPSTLSTTVETASLCLSRRSNRVLLSIASYVSSFSPIRCALARRTTSCCCPGPPFPSRP